MGEDRDISGQSNQPGSLMTREMHEMHCQLKGDSGSSASTCRRRGFGSRETELHAIGTPRRNCNTHASTVAQHAFADMVANVAKGRAFLNGLERAMLKVPRRYCKQITRSER